MPKKPSYLSKEQCTIFDFYAAGELEELLRPVAPQLGFSVQQAADGKVRFYARDAEGRKRRLPKIIVEESYINDRMHLADKLKEQGSRNSHGVMVDLKHRTERALYYQDRRDGKGLQPIDSRRAQEAMAAYRQFRDCMKEGKFEEAVQLAREYLPADCSRVAEKVLARRNGASARKGTAGKEVVRQYESLLQQGTLDSVQNAVALARKHLTRKEAEDAERKLYELYTSVSLDEFAAWETGIEDYSAQSPLEEELRIEFGGNIGDYIECDGSAEDDEESPVRRNTGAAFGKGLAGVEV